MDFFNLPARTKVGRVIPKNAFDDYTNSKQKRLFTDQVQRITWTNKFSLDTLNLDGKDVREIQIFKIELKLKTEIFKILEIINKAIPYHIVFWIEYNQEVYLSTASKHPHPTSENIAVIDWTFSSEWFLKHDNTFVFNLKGNLDVVFKDLCVQLTGRPDLEEKSMDSILENQKEIDQLEKEIKRLKSAISSTKQFNKKLDLNLKLRSTEKQLNKLKP